MTDFDLHGIVGVRLVDAGDRDVATVRRQLGPIDRRLDREPDIVVRFSERQRTPMRLIGLDDAGFSDDGYFVLRSRHKVSAMARIPMARIGERCEIVCDRGIPAVPLLIAIVNVTALAKGFVPIHASAVSYRGSGVLIAGWAKGGKTELLLGLMAGGGSYIGDEWVYLAPGGTEMYGIPEPMKIWAAHLDAMPRYRGRVRRSDRMRMTALRAGAALGQAASRVGPRSALGRLARRGAALATQQTAVHVPPAAMFGTEHCALRGSLDRIILALSTTESSVRLEDIPSSEVAARMDASVTHERMDLMGHYLKFRFAFPGERNPHLDGAEARQRELLQAALDGVPAARLIHPYPAPIESMAALVDRWLP